MAAEKARWRERFRAERRALPPERRAAASAEVARRLAVLVGERLRRQPGGAVALFWPLPGEVDLRGLAEALRRDGVPVALPAVVGESEVGASPRELVWRLFEGADQLADGPWGLSEPAASAPAAAPDGLAVVVVPGLAFGRDGSRLGMGGGFYDAALAQTPALRVGVAFAPALVDTVPVEPHDQLVDAVVTEAGVVWTGARGTSGARPARNTRPG